MRKIFDGDGEIINKGKGLGNLYQQVIKTDIPQQWSQKASLGGTCASGMSLILFLA